MASAIFAVTYPPEINLPPMADPGDGSLFLAHGEGHGYSCIGMVPQSATCLVRVWSDSATITAMQSDSRYQLLEVLEA